jgi:hypothetical protein
VLSAKPENFFSTLGASSSAAMGLIGMKFEMVVQKMARFSNMSKIFKNFQRGRGGEPSKFSTFSCLEAVFMHRSSPNFVGGQRGISEHKFGI